MKHPIRVTAACAFMMTIAACGGGHGGNDGDAATPPPQAGGGTPVAPTVKADDLPAGTYVVSAGDANKPTVGRYYASAGGRRLLALEDPNETVASLLRRTDTASNWIAVPAPGSDLDVRLLHSQPLTASTPDAATLAGRYVVRLSDGSAADLLIGADGRVSAGTLSGCRISGSLASGTLPGSLSVTLATTQCAGLPASATGVLVTDPSDAPAAWRLLGDDGKQTVDLRGYGEAAA